MSRVGIESARRSVADVRQIVESLTDDEWAMPSACAGWSVKDLIAHMGSNFHEIVEPSPAPSEPVNLPAERLMDLLVEPRRDWSAAEVGAEYLNSCDGALAALEAMQDEPLGSTVIPLADLGMYPMHQMADAFAFDHYCHVRVDLIAPTGPLHRDLPPVDDALVRPAIEWMIAGIPQMQPGLDASLLGSLRLTLTGPGGGSWLLTVIDGSIVVNIDVHMDEVAPATATVTSGAHDFVLWGTCRSSWRDHCAVTGDPAVASTFLDALNVV